MAKTKYQTLVSTKSKFCDGAVLKSDVKRAAKNYIHDKVIKSKDQVKARKEAERIANRVLRGGCAITSVITGHKKKKAKKRSKRRK